MEMNRIIGLDNIKEKIKQIVEKKEFKSFGLLPSHMLFAGMKSGNGCTTISNCITDLFYENDVRPFPEPDFSLEFKPNGKTKDSLEKVFEIIETAAVYENVYRGNIFINLDDVLPYANDSHVTDFICELSEIGEYATLFFFVDTSKRNADVLINKITSTISDVSTVNVTAYSQDELVQITKQMIEEHGIIVDEGTDAVISECIASRNINSAKGCASLKKELLKRADMSNGVLSLSVDSINSKTMC